jgi:hypothetical protein
MTKKANKVQIYYNEYGLGNRNRPLYKMIVYQRAKCIYWLLMKIWTNEIQCIDHCLSCLNYTFVSSMLVKGGVPLGLL